MPSLSTEEKRRLISLPKQSTKSNIGPWIAEIAQRGPATHAGDALDDAFIATIEKVERLVIDMSKQLKIRVEAWVKKLCQVHVNEVFLRNRNAHAELLLSCCLSENWTEPFNRMPAEGPLASLPQHVTCMIKQRHLEHRLECAKEQSRRAGGSLQGAKGNSTATGSMQAIPIVQEDDAPPDASDSFSRIENLREFSPVPDDLVRMSYGSFGTPARGDKLPNTLHGAQSPLVKLKSAASTPALKRSVDDRDIIARNKFEWTDRELKKAMLDNKRLRASVRAYRAANTQLSAQVITLKEENAALRTKVHAFEGARDAGGFAGPMEYNPQEHRGVEPRPDLRDSYSKPTRSRSPRVKNSSLPSIPNPNFPEPPPQAPSSNEEDPGVFLNYLSRFQAYTTTLYAVANVFLMTSID
jgi:hypothetical protein